MNIVSPQKFSQIKPIVYSFPAEIKQKRLKT